MNEGDWRVVCRSIPERYVGLELSVHAFKKSVHKHSRPIIAVLRHYIEIPKDL